MRGLFVTGTDTGVGKTFVGCAIVRGLRAAGIGVGVMKPVETGVPSAGPEDARALRLAAGVDDPLEAICPQQFALPAAPSVAARAEGRRVSRPAIHAAWTTLRARHDFMLVEGAGGLLVPLDEEADVADLARELGLPVLLVARASLGTLNHTRLSLEAAAHRGLDVFGVAISHSAEREPESDELNLEELRRRLGASLVLELPHRLGTPRSSKERSAASGAGGSPTIDAFVARLSHALRR